MGDVCKLHLAGVHLLVALTCTGSCPCSKQASYCISHCILYIHLSHRMIDDLELLTPVLSELAHCLEAEPCMCVRPLPAHVAVFRVLLADLPVNRRSERGKAATEKRGTKQTDTVLYSAATSKSRAETGRDKRVAHQQERQQNTESGHDGQNSCVLPRCTPPPRKNRDLVPSPCRSNLRVKPACPSWPRLLQAFQHLDLRLASFFLSLSLFCSFSKGRHASVRSKDACSTEDMRREETKQGGKHFVAIAKA